MIDMHSHLDLYPNSLKIISKVNVNNIFTLCVTTSPRAYVATSNVFKNYKNIHVALGLHPEIVDKKINEVNLLIDLIKNTKYIGEIGLDGTKDFKHTFNLQIDIFEKVLKECSNQTEKVLSIHSRGAATEVLNLLEKYPSCGTSILHWFSGTQRELDRAINLGCYFSINPKMCYAKKGMSLISKIPKEKIFPETDGPFAILNNSTLYPWDVDIVINYLSSLWELSQEQTKIQLENNLKIITF